jgi:tetratricopeptide (TPR) repeat protein
MLCTQEKSGKRDWRKYQDEIERLKRRIDSVQEEFVRNGQHAELLVAQHRHSEALQLFSSAIQGADEARKEKPDVYSSFHEHMLKTYASTLDHIGDIPAEEGIFLQLMEVYPGGQYLGDYAVFLHRRKRDFAKAQTMYEKALEAYPKDSSIHLKYAGFLRHVRRDLEGAEKYYKSAIKANPENPDALGSYASYLHGVKGDVHAAEEKYKEAVEMDSTHANNLCNYGLFLSEEKQDYIRAETYYKTVLEVTPSHSNTLYNYAVMLDSHCGRRADAEGLYERAIHVEPRHAFALYNLAVLKEEKAMVAEREALEETTLGGTKIGKSDGSEPMKQTEKEKLARRKAVCDLYARAHDADPLDATTAADYGRFLLARMDRLEDAEPVLLHALQKDPHCVVALYNMALLKQRKSLFPDAEKLYATLLALQPTHSAGTQQMGRNYIDKFKAEGNHEDIDSAMTCYERAFQLVKDPTATVLEYLKIVSNMASNKQKIRAIAFIEKYMARFGSGSLGREAQIKQVLKGMGKIATKVTTNEED